jgi:hypothetical protein
MHDSLMEARYQLVGINVPPPKEGGLLEWIARFVGTRMEVGSFQEYVEFVLFEMWERAFGEGVEFEVPV